MGNANISCPDPKSPEPVIITQKPGATNLKSSSSQHKICPPMTPKRHYEGVSDTQDCSDTQDSSEPDGLHTRLHSCIQSSHPIPQLTNGKDPASLRHAEENVDRTSKQKCLRRSYCQEALFKIGRSAIARNVLSVKYDYPGPSPWLKSEAQSWRKAAVPLEWNSGVHAPRSSCSPPASQSEIGVQTNSASVNAAEVSSEDKKRTLDKVYNAFSPMPVLGCADPTTTAAAQNQEERGLPHLHSHPRGHSGQSRLCVPYICCAPMSLPPHQFPARGRPLSAGFVPGYMMRLVSEERPQLQTNPIFGEAQPTDQAERALLGYYECCNPALIGEQAAEDYLKTLHQEQTVGISGYVYLSTIQLYTLCTFLQQ